MGDPRVRNVDGFTTIQHHTVPEYLNPSRASLPEGYTACIIGASAGIGGTFIDPIMFLIQLLVISPVPGLMASIGGIVVYAY